MATSELELEFDRLWNYLYPNIDLIAEFRAIPGRRYKFDYCHLQSKVLIEVNGQIWHKGGHSTRRVFGGKLPTEKPTWEKLCSEIMRSLTWLILLGTSYFS